MSDNENEQVSAENNVEKKVVRWLPLKTVVELTGKCPGYVHKQVQRAHKTNEELGGMKRAWCRKESDGSKEIWLVSSEYVDWKLRENAARQGRVSAVQEPAYEKTYRAVLKYVQTQAKLSAKERERFGKVLEEYRAYAEEQWKRRLAAQERNAQIKALIQKAADPETLRTILEALAEEQSK